MEEVNKIILLIENLYNKYHYKVTNIMDKVLSQPSSDLVANLIIGSIILLVALWFFTGRLSFIGWLMRLLWLPINATFFAMWLLLSFLGTLYDRKKFNFLWLFAVLMILALFEEIGLLLDNKSENFEAAVIRGAIFTITLWFCTIYREHIKRIANFYPRPLRTPQKKETRAYNPTESVEYLPKEQAPIVKIHASRSSGHDDESKIVQNLPQHLQDLLAGRINRP
jgi:hypothetical protein